MTGKCTCPATPDFSLIDGFLFSGWLSRAVYDCQRAELATALVLASEAMRQSPLGTLPSGNMELALLARCRSLDEWSEMREAVLFGWSRRLYQAEDGQLVSRLIHPVIEAHLLRAGLSEPSA